MAGKKRGTTRVHSRTVAQSHSTPKPTAQVEVIPFVILAYGSSRGNPFCNISLRLSHKPIPGHMSPASPPTQTTKIAPLSISHYAARKLKWNSHTNLNTVNSSQRISNNERISSISSSNLHLRLQMERALSTQKLQRPRYRSRPLPKFHFLLR